MSDTYWYYTYKAVRSASGREDHKVSTVPPVDFALNASARYDDGPYVILFAAPATKEQYEHYNAIQ